MDKLNQLIQKFEQDESWNTENLDGTHRFDNELQWLARTVREYAEYFKLSVDDVVEIMEKNRTYSWPNYYQPSNFPSVSSFGELAGVFRTYEEFQEYTKQHWKGFRCPVCGSIGDHPQECVHRIRQDGQCDWCAYGLFQSGTKVMVLESGFKAIPIFEPVPLEKKEESEER